MMTFEQLDAIRALTPDGVRPPPGYLGRVRQELLKWLQGHPISRRYLAQYRLGAFANTRPWQALGEQLQTMEVLALMGGPDALSGAQFGPGMDTWGQKNRVLSDERGLYWALRIQMAQVYLWSNAADKLSRSAPLPSHVISRNLMPYPAMFFSREAACGVTVGRLDGSSVDRVENRETNWVLLFDTGDTIELLYDATNAGDASMLICGGRVTYGKKYPDDYPEEFERQSVGQILQMLAFISSPYVETLKHRMDRPQRRELQRAGLPPKQVEQEVHTVVLRRAAQERQAAYDQLTAVERKHHWWVSGHYRAQWYPSTRSHQIIWIAPYIKGDLDKPLLEKVYAVTR